MRGLLLLIHLLITFAAYSQQEEIFRLTFYDPANFKITESLGNKRPHFLLIADSTQKWTTDRFWLAGFTLPSEETKKAILQDEHHPYHHTYLFQDSILNKLIDEKEKLALRNRSTLLAPKKIKLNGPGYASVHSLEKIKGFYVVASEPIFSSDGNYAFIDLLILFKKTKKAVYQDSCFGTVCIVYQKQPDQTWKKIHKKEHLIL